MNDNELQNKNEDQAFLEIDKKYSNLWKIATYLSKAEGMIPKNYNGKPHQVFAALMYGEELQLAPMQALQSIYVVNGKVALYGDAIKGICIRTGEVEKFEEYVDDAGNNVCVIKRRNFSEVRGLYTKEQYNKNLKKNTDIWKAYPERMRQLKARNLACRDAFADVFAGVYDFEADQDELKTAKTERDITPKKRNKFNNNVLEPHPPAKKIIEQPKIEVINEPVIENENEIKMQFKELKISAGKQVELKNKYSDPALLIEHLKSLKKNAEIKKEVGTVFENEDKFALQGDKNEQS